jgi:6-phosphogluconolactonase (cycloisomerase 2 family)
MSRPFRTSPRRRLASGGGLALALVAVAAGPAHASTTAAPADHDRGRGALFVQTDGLNGNAVVAYDRRSDGTLHQAGTFATGGRGGHLDGAAVDNTASQGSVALDRTHHLLYVVNAGSNSLTVFSAHGDTLRRVQVVPSHGDFPVSVSAHGSVVYVLNARSGGSVEGYRWSGGRLRAVAHRSLHLDPTLTPEFTHTPGQVAITPDGRQVVVTTKAAANTIDVFRLDGSGRLIGAPTVTAQDGKVPFAITFDPRGHLVVANAGDSSVSTFALHANGSLSPLASALTGQAATCWVTSDGRLLFASNAGSASVSAYRVGSHGGLTALGNTATDAGTVDSAVSPDGRYLYVETGAAGVVDEFAVGHDGALSPIGSVTVPDAVGAEGIAAG